MSQKEAYAWARANVRGRAASVPRRNPACALI